MAACVCFCPERLVPALPQGVIWQPSHGDEKDPWELCAMSAESAAGLVSRPLHCGTLLVPEGLYSPLWKAQQVVSYGLSPRSSLTLSSMGKRDMLCVQRVLTGSLGKAMEEQELPLPDHWRGFSPADRLLLAGTWLLWTGSVRDN